MAYAQEFFEFQLLFAQQLVERFGLPLADALQRYTTITKSVAAEDWPRYWQGLQAATNPAKWTYEWYAARRAPDPQPDDRDFYGHALFGCFYYEIRKDEMGRATIIRPHFIKNDKPGCRPLGQERLAVRQEEMRRMVQHIRLHVPMAQTVLGNSWMYNLEAYRRIFPPSFTATLPATEYAEHRFLSLWGQCFDRQWQPKQNVTDELLRRLSTLDDIAELQSCFPFAVRRPQGEITQFYKFYE